MTQQKSGITITARWLALIISLFIIFLGANIVIDEFAPGRFTRFGFAEPIYGLKAKEFGLIIILLGCLPLLLFCKHSRQTTILGTLLGIIIIASIFITAYS